MLGWYLKVWNFFFAGEESKSNEVCSTLEKELELIHKALDGKIGSSKEEKDGFLREFSKLRVTSQEQLNTAQQDKRRLKQVWVCSWELKKEKRLWHGIYSCILMISSETFIVHCFDRNLHHARPPQRRGC